MGQDLSRYLDDPKTQIMSWADLKTNLFNSFSEDDRVTAEDAIEQLKKGAPADALARMVLLSSSAKKTDEARAIAAIAFAELAARAYRGKDFSGAIEQMRQLVDTVPNSKPIMSAYGKFMLMKMGTAPMPQFGEPSSTSALPDAPAALTARVPITGDVKSYTPDQFDVR